jgi:hypothetical protein
MIRLAANRCATLNPAMAIVAPSGISAMASAGEANTLSILPGLPFRLLPSTF